MEQNLIRLLKADEIECRVSVIPSQIKSVNFDFQHRAVNQIFKKLPDTGVQFL